MPETNRPLTPYEQDCKARAELSADAVSFAICANQSGRELQFLAEHLMREHRTNQQTIMRFCSEYMLAISKQSCDLRNEAAVTLGKAYRKMIEHDPDLSVLPYV